MKTKPIKIRINKIKQIGILTMALALVANGIWLAFFGYEIFTQFKVFVVAVGIASIILFGLAGIINLINLLKKTGLTITNEGIYDNTSFVNSGLVNWKNIEDIKHRKGLFINIIGIEVNNAEVFINKQTNSLKKRVLKANLKKYGYPIQINANVLNMNHYQLVELLKEEWSKHKSMPSS